MTPTVRRLLKRLAMVPIRVPEPLGAIGTYWARPHKPSEEEVNSLRALAEIASLALENVRAHAEFEAAKRELESFSYAVSHDLHAPLRHIEGFAQILAADNTGASNDTTRQYLEHITNAAQRMSRLIDALLKLSRIARAPVLRQRIDLSALAADMVSSLRKAAPERQVQIHIAENLQANGDRQLVEIVLENLLSNAWKFTGKKAQGEIQVGSTPGDDGAATYFVRDNGAGFTMKYAHKLFGAFQRMHPAQEFPGIGIGLAIVQRIVHKHGGKVWASAEVNQGACFFFTLGAASVDAR